MTTSLLSAQNPATGSRTVAAGMARQPIRAVTHRRPRHARSSCVPPAPRLRAGLRDRLGVEVSEPEAGRAMQAEIAYYRAHCGWAATPPGWRSCGARCAEVLRDALGRARARAGGGDARRCSRRSASSRSPTPCPRCGRCAAAGVTARGGLQLGRLAARAARAHGARPSCSTARCPRPRSARAKPDPAIFVRALALAGAAPARGAARGRRRRGRRRRRAWRPGSSRC